MKQHSNGLVSRLRWLLLPIVMLVAACQTVVSDSGLVVEYAPEFMAAAAVEYDTMATSCQHNDPTTPEGCSTVKSLVNDYLQLRDRLRK